MYALKDEREVTLMREGEYVDSLISEYETILAHGELKDAEGGYDESGILKQLSGSADWSTSGARELLKLADRYGASCCATHLRLQWFLARKTALKDFRTECTGKHGCIERFTPIQGGQAR
jgi:hypothetical protein